MDTGSGPEKKRLHWEHSWLRAVEKAAARTGQVQCRALDAGKVTGAGNDSVNATQAAFRAVVVIEDFASGAVAKLFPGLKAADTPVDPRCAQKAPREAAE